MCFRPSPSRTPPGGPAGIAGEWSPLVAVPAWSWRSLSGCSLRLSIRPRGSPPSIWSGGWFWFPRAGIWFWRSRWATRWHCSGRARTAASFLSPEKQNECSMSWYNLFQWKRPTHHNNIKYCTEQSKFNVISVHLRIMRDTILFFKANLLSNRFPNLFLR